MPIRRVQVSSFRCLQSAELAFDSRFTLIKGRNASGKTSLLEAVYILGRGRSFRTRRIENLIARGGSKFVTYGEVQLPDRRLGLGVEGSPGGLKARIGGEQPSSLAELALSFPVQIIDPEVHRLIEEGPGRRRRFLDWGVFHVEPTFVAHWQRYQQVLRQRNAALASRAAPASVGAWNTDLIRYGELLTEARVRYLAVLAREATALVNRLFQRDLALTYRTGWGGDRSFSEALASTAAQERESGATQVGPQRGELVIRLDGQSVKDRVSRGQQKLLAAALLLAQLRLLPVDSAPAPTLLLDDPAAELDGDNLLALIEEVGTQPFQLIVTTLSPLSSVFGEPGRVYAVHEGTVTEA